MFLYRMRKKTNEELYESNVRSNFVATKQQAFALVIDDFCLLLGGYFGKV